MEVYPEAFVNHKQNDQIKWLLIAEFAYNNAKNTSTGHSPFEIICVFYPSASYKDDVDPLSKSKVADKLATELRELTTVYRDNLENV